MFCNFATLGKTYYFCLVCDFHHRQCSFYLQSQNGFATLELALPHTETGGKKGCLMKGLNPAPTCTFFPPCFFSCPVELIWQRGGSINQFTQAAAAFFCSGLLLCSPCLYFHPHPPLSSLCVGLFAHVCVHVCVLLHALGGGIISCTIMWFNPWGWTHLPHTGCAAQVTAQVLPPTFTYLPGL